MRGASKPYSGKRQQVNVVRRGSNAEARSGDTIVVPLETDRIRLLTFWTNATQILYQGAIVIAAICVLVQHY